MSAIDPRTARAAVPARASNSLGIHLKLAATLCMTVMLASIKGLGGAVPVGQIAFFRSLATLLPLLAWIVATRRTREIFRPSHLMRHLGRGISGSLSMFLSFVTLACLPLVDAVLLGYAAPAMTLMLALLLLREPVPGYRWLSAGIGALGVGVALMPNMQAWRDPSQVPAAALLGIAAGLLGAFFTALSVIQIRSLAAVERPGAIVFYYTLVTGALGAGSAVFGWVALDHRQLGLLLLAGLSGGAANLLVAQSLRHAHASVTAPFEYATLLWSSLISYAVFGQAPGLAVFAGGALIVASGVLTAWQEWRPKRPPAACGR